jgi:hypothetical protein
VVLKLLETPETLLLPKMFESGNYLNATSLQVGISPWACCSCKLSLPRIINGHLAITQLVMGNPINGKMTTSLVHLIQTNQSVPHSTERSLACDEGFRPSMKASVEPACK